LFSRKDWKNYHNWVDLYIDELEKDISQDTFFNFINWKTAHTIIQCFKINKTPPNDDLSSLSQDLEKDTLNE
jgi:hypothetical protein